MITAFFKRLNTTKIAIGALLSFPKQLYKIKYNIKRFFTKYKIGLNMEFKRMIFIK